MLEALSAAPHLAEIGLRARRVSPITTYTKMHGLAPRGSRRAPFGIPSTKQETEALFDALEQSK